MSWAICEPSALSWCTASRVAFDGRWLRYIGTPSQTKNVGGSTFFVWEGVPMYLTRVAVKATLDAVHQLSADGSQIAHDMWFLVDEPGTLGTARRSAPGALSLIGEPVTFGMHPEDYEYFLQRHGFHLLDLAFPSELQARFAPETRASSWTTRCTSSLLNASHLKSSPEPNPLRWRT